MNDVYENGNESWKMSKECSIWEMENESERE